MILKSFTNKLQLETKAIYSEDASMNKKTIAETNKHFVYYESLEEFPYMDLSVDEGENTLCKDGAVGNPRIITHNRKNSLLWSDHRRENKIFIQNRVDNIVVFYSSDLNELVFGRT